MTSTSQQNAPRVILIDLIEPSTRKHEAIERMNELEELVTTYGGFVVVKKLQRRQIPNYRTYIGSGKVEELLSFAKEERVSLIVVGNILKPQQIYNLEGSFQKISVSVWDRVDLILHIFSKHASSQEAKLQIEIAKIRHMGPRIFGLGGDELARQAGGIGTRGIGETNTEIMKRHLRSAERTIRAKLDRIEAMRQEHRKNRERHGFKTLSIVGYTNAGKTSLLNALTGRKEYAADKLFATLGTRTGELYLPDKEQRVLLTDTIGFIRNLPPELIDAFRSTLGETIHAQAILHIIDASDPLRKEKIQVVREILEKLGVTQTPTIHVFNKADLLTKEAQAEILTSFADDLPVLVSANSGFSLEALRTRIANVV